METTHKGEDLRYRVARSVDEVKSLRAACDDDSEHLWNAVNNLASKVDDIDERLTAIEYHAR
ncbi:hypothetical protein [Schaalia sp. ZJ1691]|uniref:hypothetical protein n=1 Tax=Schaalia sp. ZJ1691 TaxID=2709404 RepID=UPI0013EADB10|nr:hypothetical protein [Schaalia sp. ZJ1691]